MKIILYTFALLSLCLTSGCGVNFFGEEHVHLHLYGLEDEQIDEFRSQLNNDPEVDVRIDRSPPYMQAPPAPHGA